MQPEENLPIDIHYNKLLDWLINRRHCNHQWQSSALVIREKINNAIQDMPPVEELTTLLQGTYINYFHCQRIVELLKDTEASSKNIFGRYSSQRMKDWQEVVKLYEKDDIFLAEAAQLLMRNVNYEMPSLKRQIAKCQQVQTDCTRKEGEYATQSSELKDKFHTRCKTMGIEGKKIKTELWALVKDMPATYDRISKQVSILQPAVQYYSSFVEYTLAKKELGDECVPLVKFLMEKGNATVFEWKHGRCPSKVEEPKLDLSINDEEDQDENKTDEIDWGNMDAADEIDFGISLDDDDGAIDFGDQDGGVDIDWGEGAPTVDIEVVDTAESQLDDGDVARGSEALTLLDNTETRNLVVDELLELEAFLGQREAELKDQSNVLASNQFQSAPERLQVDSQVVLDMLRDVQSVLEHLTQKKMQDLFLIRSSPRYVDRLAESLKKDLTDSEKMMSLSRLMVTRREEALQEQKDTEPKLDLIRQKTKILQKQIAGEISKKYQNRRVNIMGEINTI